MRPDPASRPHASIGRLLEHLGTTVLDIAAGEPDPAAEVGGVVIYDPLDPPPLPGHALVLGVGVQGSQEVAELVAAIGDRGGVGLVIRAPAPADDTVRAAVARTGTTLFALTRGASWNQLAALLRSLLAEDGLAAAGETIGGVPAGDLFALANAVAGLLDAPVTIEDRSSRVLAFSGRQDEADRSRVETILGRQVPERYTRVLERCGVFHALYGSDRPVVVDVQSPDVPEIEIPRVAIAVRAGDEILGSIWVASRRPLSPEREEALTEAGKLAALHMLRLRAGADVERRLRADLVATALEGGPRAAEAVSRLGLAGRPAVVLALGLPEDRSGAAASLARLETERQRAADALALHLSAVQGGAAVALLGGVAYGIVPVLSGRDDADERVAAVARDFLERTGGRVPGLAGVGRVAHDAAGLTRSRADADRALRVLRSRGGSPRVARAADVHTESLLLELGDLAGPDARAPTGAVARLLDYDRAHGGMLTPTLRAWLDTFGDVIAAAAALRVHPNTFRYRMRRVTEVSGFDPDDADARFAAMLQLRLLGATAIRPEAPD
ncbi:MAG: helix-turn-helix domain-containing protein [Actinobacteria bacterium]|nr:helix-turn-helix domain-containing protein [Actinomycetota bacterium]MBO0786272.1 helix-turn-helix domain-containing protein [Actinomycetota bacterium]